MYASHLWCSCAFHYVFVASHDGVLQLWIPSPPLIITPPPPLPPTSPFPAPITERSTGLPTVLTIRRKFQRRRGQRQRRGVDFTTILTPRDDDRLLMYRDITPRPCSGMDAVGYLSAGLSGQLMDRPQRCLPQARSQARSSAL